MDKFHAFIHSPIHPSIHPVTHPATHEYIYATTSFSHLPYPQWPSNGKTYIAIWILDHFFQLLYINKSSSPETLNYDGNQLGNKALKKKSKILLTTIFKGYINPKKLSYCKAHQETKTEKSEDPKGNDGGYEQGGGEVDGGLCPVHREP